jgi:hypothetical protein
MRCTFAKGVEFASAFRPHLSCRGYRREAAATQLPRFVHPSAACFAVHTHLARCSHPQAPPRHWRNQ